MKNKLNTLGWLIRVAWNCIFVIPKVLWDVVKNRLSASVARVRTRGKDKLKWM